MREVFNAQLPSPSARSYVYVVGKKKNKLRTLHPHRSRTVTSGNAIAIRSLIILRCADRCCVYTNNACNHLLKSE